MLVVSSYTPAYAGCAERLKRSCDALGVPVRLVPVAGRADLHGWPAWMQNCHRCFDAVYTALVTQEDDVLWADADATVERFPARLAGLSDDPVDLAVYFTPWGELADGTFWARNCRRVKAFLRDLIALCKDKFDAWLSSKPRPNHRPPKNVWEQQILQDSLSVLATRHGVRVGTLRHSECFIFDNSRQKAALEEEPVVVHWQASRGEDVPARGSLPVLFPDALAVLRSLCRPVLVVGNGPWNPSETGCPSVLWFNNGTRRKAPQAVWVANCWPDVPVPSSDQGVTLCPYTPGHTVHPVEDWGIALERSTRRALAVPRTDWAGEARAWAAKHGVRNASTGLVLLHRLSEEGIAWQAEGFTGLPGPEHSDERRALRSLGVRC